MPDLTILGKIVGGGLPIGAYGGRAEIMEHVLPAGRIFQAGTLSGNPLATAAGIATLRLLRDEPPYAAARNARRPTGRRAARAAAEARLEHCVTRVGSMMTLFFNPGPVTDWETASALRHGPLRPVLLGVVGPRRLHAVQPIRGLVCVRRPRGGPYRSDGRRRGPGAGRGSGTPMTQLVTHPWTAGP